MSIKTPEEIEKMRIAGRLGAEVLEMIEEYVVPGVTTEELDRLCSDYTTNVQKAVSAPLNYKGFPKSICTSVNHVVCHGIPGPKKLKSGDIVNIDVTVLKDGYHGDTSKMFMVGKPSVRAKRLVEVTQQCLYVGIELVKDGVDLKEIGAAIQKYAEKQHFSVVREFCGHGIGSIFHEDDLHVVHYDSKDIPSRILRAGETLTIEPMINAGKKETTLLPDGWTAVTKDRSLSAQWEHTLLVMESGCEVLTKRKEENF